MPKRVHLPDGRIVHFPDSMQPADIQAAMVKLSGGAPPPQPQAPRPPDWSEQLGLHTPTASPALGVLRGAGTAAVDLAEGFVSGAAGMMFGGGDLIRRGLGMERVIERPAVQEAMRAPESFAGQVGRLLEQGAEFAVPLTRVSRAVQGAGLLKRSAAEAAASAGVAGVQTGGEPGAMVAGGAGGAVLPFAGAALRAGRRAAAGAQEGGLGGAIAGAVRTVAPSEPRVMLMQALKPRNSLTSFPRALERAIPELKAAEQASGQPIANIQALLDATKVAKADIQAQLNQMRGTQRAIGAEVDLSSVADAMMRSIPRKVQLETPAVAARLKGAADVYRGQFTLDEAETLLRETNAELEGFYAMFPQGQRARLVSNPAAAALDAQAKALRHAIYTKLDDPGAGEAARELNRRYGALLEVEDVAFRRSNVAARQQPESLSEQIGAVRAAGEMARGTWRLLHGDLAGAADLAAAHAGRTTAKAIKESQTTDALIKRAFASYKGQRVPVEMPPPRRIAGALPPASRLMPAAPDPSFVRGVPAVPAQSERLALPAGRVPRPMPAAPDPSFVRGVRGEYGSRVEPQAAPARASTPLSPSSARVSVRAAKYRDKSGFKIAGMDARGRRVSIFAETREAAEHIAKKVRGGEEVTVADFSFGRN